MNTIQSNILRMFKEVLSMLDSKENVWKNVALVATCVERLRSISNNIEAAATHQQSSNPTGYTAAKEQQRDKLEDQTHQAAVRLRCFATATQNIALRTAVRVPRAALGRKKNSELLTYSRVVADACEANLPALAEYRVDANLVAALRESIELTSQMFSHRDVVIDQRMGATGRLNSLVNDGRICLKSLDDLVEAMIDDDTFVTEYTNARRIYDLRGRRIASSESKLDGAAQ
jgi:hypothetical protein